MNAPNALLEAQDSTNPIVLSRRRLVASCPDQPGIVSAVSRFLHDAGANIIQSDQYSSDPFGGTFYLRMEFAGNDEVIEGLAERFGVVAERFGMTWRFGNPDRPKRVAILVSKEDHCLQDLLYRWRRNELEAQVVLVASNHPDHRAAVEALGLPFHHIPVASKSGKPEAERQLLEVLDGNCDLVVLARYMQILSGDFLRRAGIPVINIHHSFLPAFAGAGPYGRARERGVKLIGATAHYVTEELDEGPIIEQDVNRVNHRHDVAALTRLGADVERTVLARAVGWHCEDRVLRHGNTTVVF
ncbi:formyltetrahydrofolate deformylase [Streptomyces sp. NPDC051322]|uniref:formyltetrahydrofolate deformylase n=1 Tax=Streptomyces sp. NPDC051322 TaxID=3154645 RepID=UPI00344DCEDE